MVEFAGHRSQARFDISQALAVSQLRKRHCEILVQAREASQVRVATIAGHALLEFVCGQVVHDLGKDGASEVHTSLCSLSLFPPEQQNPVAWNSNRKIQEAFHRYAS